MLNENTWEHENQEVNLNNSNNTNNTNNSNELSETKIINVNDLVEVIAENENSKGKN
jgi:hypothetical protein